MKQNISRKVTSKDNGKGQPEDGDKFLAWKFHRWSRTIPIRVHTVDVRKVSLYLSGETMFFVQLLVLRSLSAGTFTGVNWLGHPWANPFQTNMGG